MDEREPSGSIDNTKHGMASKLSDGELFLFG